MPRKIPSPIKNFMLRQTWEDKPEDGRVKIVTSIAKPKNEKVKPT
jgi:hypothetical protein